MRSWPWPWIIGVGLVLYVAYKNRQTITATALGCSSEYVLNAIADAIELQEGYYPGSLAFRNQNPGNLIFLSQRGAVLGEGGFAKFKTYADGRAALIRQLGLYCGRGLSIRSMIAIYAPAGDGDNNPAAYAQNVSNRTGFDLDTPIRALG